MLLGLELRSLCQVCKHFLLYFLLQALNFHAVLLDLHFKLVSVILPRLQDIHLNLFYLPLFSLRDVLDFLVCRPYTPFVQFIPTDFIFIYNFKYFSNLSIGNC